MVSIRRDCDRNVKALITDMSSPLGYAVGNSLEVAEAVKYLKARYLAFNRALHSTCRKYDKSYQRN